MTGDFVAEYATRRLEVPEQLLLLRHRDALSGRVLDLGCGAGRLTGYLAELSPEVHAIDISPTMLAHSTQAYPGVTFEERDLRDLGGFGDGTFDAVVAACNMLDAFDQDERLMVLGEIHRILAPGGVLLMSSHNRAYIPHLHGPRWLLSRHPQLLAERIGRFPQRMRNHRRVRDRQRSEAEYAIVNDDAHDYRFLHYYIAPDAMARQLTGLGFEVLDRLDLDGRSIGAGEDAAHCVQIHYAARRP